MRLPPDVIIEIINHLDSLDAPPTLANCALISWAFKDISERMLYKTVHIWLSNHPGYWKYVACLQTLSTTSKGTLVREFSLDISMPFEVPSELWPMDDICYALLAMNNLEELSLYSQGSPPPGTFARLNQCIIACTFQLKRLSIQHSALDIENGPWTDKQRRLKVIQLLDGFISYAFFQAIERLIQPHSNGALCLFRHCRYPHSAAGGLHGAISAFPYLHSDAASWSAEPIREALGDTAASVPIFKIALSEFGNGHALEPILESVAKCFPRIIYLKLQSDTLSLDSDPRGIATALQHLQPLRRLAVEPIHYREGMDTTAYESLDGRKRLATLWSKYSPSLCWIRFPNFRTIRRESENSEWGAIV